MGFPAIQARNGLKAIAAPLLPTPWISEAPLQGQPQGIGVGDIHQQAVAALPQDVAGAAVVGGDHRQTGGGRFQQGEPEGFGEGGIHEHPTKASSPAVEGRNLLPAHLAGQSHPTAQGWMAQPALHLGQHLPPLAPTGEAGGRIPHHQHQIVMALQDAGSAESLQQGGNVLAAVGTADRQERRTVGLLKLGLKMGLQSGARALLLHSGPGGIEAACVHPRWNHPGPLWPEASVMGILLLQFLKGTGDHKRSLGEGEFLGLDAPLEGIAALNRGGVMA